MTRRTTLGLALLTTLALTAGPAAAQDNPDNLRFAALNDPGIDRVQKLLIEHYESTHPGAKVTVEYIAPTPGQDVQYRTRGRRTRARAPQPV